MLGIKPLLYRHVAENGIVLRKFRIAEINIEYVFTANVVHIPIQNEHFHPGHDCVLLFDLYAVKLAGFFVDCGFGQKYTLAAADIITVLDSEGAKTAVASFSISPFVYDP